MIDPIRRRARRLPLFWKVLLPFLGLLLVVGLAGTFIIVRDLSARANAQLDRDLSGRSLDTRTALHDRELYLLESVNFASNLKGMADAIVARDARASSELLGSVVALKGDLDLLIVTDRGGRRLAGSAVDRADTEEDRRALVEAALSASDGGRTSGLIEVDGKPMVAIAGAVCASWNPCVPAGAAIAGMSLEDLAGEALTRSIGDPSSSGPQGISIFANDGALLATAGLTAPTPTDDDESSLVREHSDGDAATIYSAYSVQGRRVGTIAVTTPKAAAFASVRGAGLRLAAIILAAMAGIVGLGAMLSRFILAQVRPLVTTSRALGRGERSARAPVIAEDELGELAQGLNQMAEQLQASYETLESRVTQRTEEVRRLLAERTEFFASMSHELRTPLAVILSEADLLVEATRPVPAREARDTGDTIRASGDQLLVVINEVLELARADAGRVEVQIDSVRLADVIKDFRPTIEGLARANDITLQIRLPKDLPPVMGDRKRLREVLLNLVDNAVKYTPEGGTVTITAAEQDDAIALSVADTGVGIPPETGNRIFEPFFRVEGIRPLRGQASTGLGLALAKRFVEAQGGTLTFVSAPGAGSTFTCMLDIASTAKRARRRPIKRSA